MANPPKARSPRVLGAAILLPFLGLFLLMPPVIQLFTFGREIGGVPLVVVYLFGVWLGLIVCAGALSRYLVRGSPSDAGHHPAGPPGKVVNPRE
jgi:hypothetical protein